MIKLFINKTTASLLKYCVRLEMGLINKQKLPMFSSPRFTCCFSFSVRLKWQPSVHHYVMSYFQHLNSIAIIKKYQANRWWFWSSPQTWWLEHTLLVAGEVHTLLQMMSHQPKTTCPHLWMSEGHLNPPAMTNSEVKSEQCQLSGRACLWGLFILFLNHRCSTPLCPEHQQVRSIWIFPCKKK